MTTQMQKYNLQQVNAVLFAGFEYSIPDETINMFFDKLLEYPFF